MNCSFCDEYAENSFTLILALFSHQQILARPDLSLITFLKKVNIIIGKCGVWFLQ